MSTPTQKDDDLFILPEDGASLDFEDVSKKAENNSDQITTIDENPDDFAFTLEDEQNTAPTEQNQEKSDDIDLLSLDTKDSLSSLSDSILSEPTKSEETANFDLGEFANKTEDEPINSSGNIGDMSDILTKTISDLTQRENLIDGNISEKEKHIGDLEKELKTERDLVSDLKSEKDAIEKNRDSLEQMKKDFEKKDEKSKK
ncbi:hypothetical protein BKN14_01635 [Candidatus Gracilibacteria bacterium HOT-871]|nr:hypothetical protein BKN14_01635 [Candidatus Gracilibacteria bacterium HOT-871]RKW22203.1 MAG: hypothetical protein D8B46_05795 [Candidatus Gracilibacteria bacterium]